jgi:hypothetical protein
MQSFAGCSLLPRQQHTIHQACAWILSRSSETSRVHQRCWFASEHYTNQVQQAAVKVHLIAFCLALCCSMCSYAAAACFAVTCAAAVVLMYCSAACRPGFGGSSCTKCEPGSYSGGGPANDVSGACKACPGGTSSPEGAGSIQQCTSGVWGCLLHCATISVTSCHHL